MALEQIQEISSSPFHAGEKEIQDRLGVREQMERFGRKVIRDHLPDQQRLLLNATVIPGDPLADGLQSGAQIGGLGLEFATRRRNRFAARVGDDGTAGIELLIDQAFGNCPQYIQTRQPEFRRRSARSPVYRRGGRHRLPAPWDRPPPAPRWR